MPVGAPSLVWDWAPLARANAPQGIVSWLESRESCIKFRMNGVHLVLPPKKLYIGF